MADTTIVEKKRNYSWAIFLIVLGIVFFLNTTNVVGWAIWLYVARFWPILIILVGLRIISGNSGFGRFISAFLTFFLTISVFTISYMQLTSKPIPIFPDKVNSWVLDGGSGIVNLGRELSSSTESLSFSQYQGVIERNLNIEVGAGKFILKEDDIDDYILINSHYPDTYKPPELIHDMQSQILDITFKGATSRGFQLFYDNSSYDITTGQLSLPINIDINLGAGSGQMMFNTTPINNFYSEVGAGKLSVDFNFASIPAGEIHLFVGAGEMNLNLPSRVGYTLEYDLGIGDIRIDGESISKFSSDRKKYTSANYDKSSTKINILVNVGVGSFHIGTL